MWLQISANNLNFFRKIEFFVKPKAIIWSLVIFEISKFDCT